MPPRRVSQAEAVAEVAAMARDETAFIGIDGLGGSGKSSFARRVAAAVAGSVIVSVDEFSGPEIPEWDWRRLHEQLVVPLLAGRPARYERRTWDSAAAGEWRTVEPNRLVIVEGVSATRDEAQVPWRLRVWVEARPDVRLARVMIRDTEAMRRQWLAHWIPSEQAYLAAQRPDERADFLVSGEE